LERLEIFENLGVALALGLLIGLERGWKRREEAEGARFAGIRTFAITGLAGGVMAVLGRVADPWVLVISIVAFVFLIIGGMMRPVMKDEDRSVTGYVAMFMTLLIGVLAGYGYLASSAAAAVVTTILLGIKAPLHDWVRRLESDEITAFLKLLLISVVVLPLLPDKGYGPWQALNPFQIWWMVVLVSAISFAGFVAVKWAGPRRGILMTAFFGGLISSTAIAVSFAKFGRDNRRLSRLLAAGVGASSTMMFARMLVISAAVSREFALTLLPILAVILAGGALGVILLWRQEEDGGKSGPPLESSFSLRLPLQFGAFLGLVMLLADGALVWLGTHGLYLVAAIAGLTDVDAITLSVAGDISQGLDLKIASSAVLIAALVNTVVKALIVTVAGGAAMARLVAIPFGLMVLGGIAGYLLF
jgi:uncharacterized membrane protein (DUF4010 family)